MLLLEWRWLDTGCSRLKSRTDGSAATQIALSCNQLKVCAHPSLVKLSVSDLTGHHHNANFLGLIGSQRTGQ
jgi:hypothetical protein